MGGNGVTCFRLSRKSQESRRFGMAMRLLFSIFVLMASPSYCQLPLQGPLRIDCGNVNLQEAHFQDNGLDWLGDIGYTGGSEHTLNASLSADLSKEYLTLRAFDIKKDAVQPGIKIPDEAYQGCYNIGVRPGHYLIRAGFAHFNWDGSDTDPYMAATINGVPAEVLSFPMNQVFFTSWMVSIQDTVISFCLRKLDTVPFINLLEILPQDARAYSVPATGPGGDVLLSMHLRVNVGGDEISEAEDSGGYRLWDSDETLFTENLANIMATLVPSTVNPPYVYYNLPQKLFQSARVATAESEGVLSLTFGSVLSVDNNDFLILLYFSEIQEGNRPPVGGRVFDIVVNNQTIQENFDILSVAGGYNTGVIVNCTVKLMAGSTIDIKLISKSMPDYLPILSGLEAYEIIQNDPEPPIMPDTPVRIDCGAPISHKNPRGYSWLYDRGYSSGYAADFFGQEESNNNSMKTNVRFFPEGDVNCYVLDMPSGAPYLVRPTFIYGNYDGNKSPPRFSLAIQKEYVFKNFTTKNLTVEEPGIKYGTMDVIAQPGLDGRISVCFITEDDSDTVPFVNGLEFLPLQPDAYAKYYQQELGYVPETTMLALEARINCGGADFGDSIDNITAMSRDLGGQIIFQESDSGYRVWYKDVSLKPNVNFASPGNPVPVGPTKATIVNQASGGPERFPNQLYATARTTQRVANLEYVIKLSGNDYLDPDCRILCLLHFAELNPNARKGSRVFDVKIDLQTVLPRLDIVNATGAPFSAYVFSYMLRPSRDYIRIDLTPVRGSALPAIISGIEVLRLVKVPVGTASADEDAMQILKASMLLGDDWGWQGDPCFPEQWAGVTCRDFSEPNTQQEQPNRITEIVLSNLESDPPTNGTISTDIGRLTELTRLTLTRLGLQGSIPAELFQLTNLQILDLSNNNLSGPIPDAIPKMMERNKNLAINLGGNPLLCGGYGYPKCGGGGGLSAGAIAGIVLSLVFVAAVATAALVVYRRRRAAYAFQRMDSGLSDSDILKGPDTMGAGSERRRANPRSMKLPPRSNSSLGRSDSFSSTGSSSRFSSQQRSRDIMDVELNSHHDSLVANGNGNGNGYGNGGSGRGGSRLRPNEDVNYVGYDG